MTLDGFIAVFLVGIGGGGLLELYKWYGLRESPNWPDYCRSARYWTVTALMILAGGALAALYGVHGVNAILALNIGLSAPAIIRSLSQATPEVGGGTGGGRRARRPDHGRSRALPRLRDFLAGV